MGFSYPSILNDLILLIYTNDALIEWHLVDYPIEWIIKMNWGTYQRYSEKMIRKTEAVEFMKNCKIILKDL